jgi:hypothetical protein
MGRQIHVYMMPDDREAFLRFVQKNDLVAVISEGSDSLIVRPLEVRDFHVHKNVYLWNRRFLPSFKRKWMPGPRYYGASVFDLPLLQLTGSTFTTWEDKPAIVQGRLYGVFDPDLEKPPGFEKWYESIVRWVRKNYRKNPTTMGGYLGSNANQLFEEGGYLLPQFLPPRTDVWLAKIGKQHSSCPSGLIVHT